MQGYISGIVRLRGEDLIVRVITRRRLLSLYRFYGMRHSIINIGRKIDFEVDSSGVFMPRLRSIAQLGFTWESDNARLYHWQEFLKLLNSHLHDIEELPEFYFELLDSAAIMLQKQSPSRLLLDCYARILDFEGRKILNKNCFICNGSLDSKIVITRGFLAAHKACIPNENHYLIAREAFFDFLDSQKSMFLSGEDVNYLLKIMAQGL